MTYARAARFPLLVSPLLVFPREILLTNTGLVGAGAAWPTANLAIYIPFELPVDATVNGVSFNCTSGNSAGRNFDVGIFDGTTGVKLSSSGSTLMAAGVNTWAASQPVSGGSRYYVGMSANSTSLLVWRAAPTALQLRTIGVAQEASAVPLPSTATFAQIASAYFPYITLTFANLP